MQRQHENEMEEIMKGMECPEDFSCYRKGFRDICKAKDFGIETILECLEEDAEECSFSYAYGHLHFCKCPMRNFAARRLNR
ncbi:MAG TPA: hypothetical protein ENO08_04225 [Candidatus Eisenbacteria bacterium]|uniref:Uncharacterized protein n=1 Tax=Eiseniibacteriota bacterium TaxID=2212470 RepID=A0A7V2AUS8_UNCEI|nr:hypothetical protein [Candidatus Eisenbacteria bacterium]